jgi:hypothetical protein
MTTLPKKLQVEAVLTTTSPVTQVADVDVNNAVVRGTEVLATVEIGSLSKTAPIIIIVRKPNTRLLAGLNVLRETTARLCFGMIFSGISILLGFTRISNVPFISREASIVYPYETNIIPEDTFCQYILPIKTVYPQFGRGPPEVYNLFKLNSHKVCIVGLS